MRLDQIVALAGARPDAAGARAGRIDIADLAYDSRSAGPGTLFFCLRGARDDGHRYAARAEAAGALAVVAEHPVETALPQVIVPDARAAMNRVAAPFFGHPGRRLAVVGVTGTNGKTTTTFMLDAIFRAAGLASGLIGTVEVRVAGEALPAGRTTPESADLQRWLARMLEAGVGSCAMEVTSIGLALGRVEGTPFQVAVFTNLTRDHLDHHGTMERYYETKRGLFDPERARAALVNADDRYGRRLAAETAVEALTYGAEQDADLRAVDVRVSARGGRFRAVGAGLDLDVRVRLPGAFNVSNALAAAGAAHLLGIPAGAIVEGIGELAGVPGRFEPVDLGQDFAVIVDYAHTPDGLANALRSARAIAPGRVIAVFGCGGDRDRGKRPLMGEAAAKHADLAVVTSDNPRSEDPLRIISEIEEGLAPAPPPEGYRLVPERREAIGTAVGGARTGDVVVIAGKGHETGQEVAGRTIPFDDRKVASDALRSRLGRGRP